MRQLWFLPAGEKQGHIGIPQDICKNNNIHKIFERVDLTHTCSKKRLNSVATANSHFIIMSSLPMMMLEDDKQI